MSDTIVINGKKYYEEGYLLMANNTVERRGRKIKKLEAEVLLLNIYVGCEIDELEEMGQRIIIAQKMIDEANYKLIYQGGYVQQVVDQTLSMVRR